MRLLATLKQNGYTHRDHVFGTLVEIDWATRAVVRELRLPTASFRHWCAYMAPSANGLVHVDGRVFVAMWNHVVEVDLESFTVRNAISDPWMADLHGMATDGTHLWVVSSAVETLLCYALSDLTLRWRWGPMAPILERGAPWWNPLGPIRRRIADAIGGEFRHVHKSRSAFSRHHMNDVRHHDGMLYVMTHRWFRDRGGAVIRLDPRTRQAEFFSPPGSFPGMHDGEFVDGELVVTLSRENAAATRHVDGTITRHPLAPTPYFVRGLCQGATPGASFLVGFSPRRHARTPALIVEYDRTFTRELGRMELRGCYPATHGTAVHALVRLG